MGSDIFASEAFIQPGAGGSGLSVLTVHRDFCDLAGHTQSPSSVNGKRLPTGGMIRQLAHESRKGSAEGSFPAFIHSGRQSIRLVFYIPQAPAESLSQHSGQPGSSITAGSSVSFCSSIQSAFSRAMPQGPCTLGIHLKGNKISVLLILLPVIRGRLDKCFFPVRFLWSYTLFCLYVPLDAALDDFCTFFICQVMPPHS